MTTQIHNLPCKKCPSSDGCTQYLDNGMFKCFSCGKFWWDKTKTFSNVERPKKANEGFPRDFTFNIPEVHKKWYSKHDLTDDDCPFGWSDAYQRIIIPFFSEEEDFWIGRSVHPNQDKKYHCPAGQKYYPYMYNSRVEYDRLVLTEDVLSAIKVGKSEPLHAWALLGTFKPKVLEYIKQLSPNKIIIWLDGDKAGILGARKLFNDLSLKYDCRIIQTEKDPKCYSIAEVRELLNEK